MHARGLVLIPGVRMRGYLSDGAEDRAGTPRLLFSRNEGPANDGATDRTPSAESLVHGSRQICLVVDGAFGFDLGIGDVTHRNPTGSGVTHLLGDQTQDGIAHLRNST